MSTGLASFPPREMVAFFLPPDPSCGPGRVDPTAGQPGDRPSLSFFSTTTLLHITKSPPFSFPIGLDVGIHPSPVTAPGQPTRTKSTFSSKNAPPSDAAAPFWPIMTSSLAGSPAETLLSNPVGDIMTQLPLTASSQLPQQPLAKAVAKPCRHWALSAICSRTTGTMTSQCVVHCLDQRAQDRMNPARTPANARKNLKNANFQYSLSSPTDVLIPYSILAPIALTKC
jgi:hypothetical protein